MVVHVCGLNNHLNGSEDKMRYNSDVLNLPEELLTADNDESLDFEGFTRCELIRHSLNFYIKSSNIY